MGPWIVTAMTADGRRAARVLQRNLLVYRRVWRGSLFGSFLTPLLYLTAMGIGLGALIGAAAARDVLRRRTRTSTSWARASWPPPACRRRASSRPSRSWARSPGAGTTRRCWPRRSRSGTSARRRAEVDRLPADHDGDRLPGRDDPVRHPAQPAGAARHPAAVLTGLAFSARRSSPSPPPRATTPASPGCSDSSSTRSSCSAARSSRSRQLPDALEWVAAATPLYHGVALVRGAMLRPTCSAAWPLHLAYLVVFLVASRGTSPIACCAAGW